MERAAGPSLAGRGALSAGVEHLTDFAVGDAFLVAALRVPRDHAAPERHGDRVAQVLGDLPAPGETIEDELDRGATDAAAAVRARDEEFGHAVIDGRPARRGTAARDHRETHRVGTAHDDEGIHRRISEPAGQLVLRAVADFAERRRAEHAGVERREIVEIVAVDAFDPLAIAAVAARITNTDGHASPPEFMPTEKTKPGQTFSRSARAVI